VKVNDFPSITYLDETSLESLRSLKLLKLSKFPSSNLRVTFLIRTFLSSEAEESLRALNSQKENSTSSAKS
jgi:hypothetical protein